ERLLLHTQAPELMLENDRHLLRILFAEEIGNGDTRKLRLERQVEVMRADEAGLLDALERIAHDTAKSSVRQRLIADKVLCHFRALRKAETKRGACRVNRERPLEAWGAACHIKPRGIGPIGDGGNGD